MYGKRPIWLSKWAKGWSRDVLVRLSVLWRWKDKDVKLLPIHELAEEYRMLSVSHVRLCTPVVTRGMMSMSSVSDFRHHR